MYVYVCVCVCIQGVCVCIQGVYNLWEEIFTLQNNCFTLLFLKQLWNCYGYTYCTIKLPRSTDQHINTPDYFYRNYGRIYEYIYIYIYMCVCVCVCVCERMSIGVVF